MRIINYMGVEMGISFQIAGSPIDYPFTPELYKFKTLNVDRGPVVHSKKIDDVVTLSGNSPFSDEDARTFYKVAVSECRELYNKNLVSIDPNSPERLNAPFEKRLLERLGDAYGRSQSYIWTQGLADRETPIPSEYLESDRVLGEMHAKVSKEIDLVLSHKRPHVLRPPIAAIPLTAPTLPEAISLPLESADCKASVEEVNPLPTNPANSAEGSAPSELTLPDQGAAPNKKQKLGFERASNFLKFFGLK